VLNPGGKHIVSNPVGLVKLLRFVVHTILPAVVGESMVPYNSWQ